MQRADGDGSFGAKESHVFSSKNEPPGSVVLKSHK
jgi:hypothetical protein